MPRLSLVAVLVCAVGLLAGCQTDLPGKAGAGAVNPNAMTGDAIDVKALDVEPPPAKMVDILPGGALEGADQGALPPASAAARTVKGAEKDSGARAESASKPTAEDAPKAAPGAEPPETVATPAPPKSASQLACEKKKGRWARVGKGEARACVFQTRDSGKRCTRESQCEGACLARSGTCAPFKPMYGCHEILQDNGARVTLCLE